MEVVKEDYLLDMGFTKGFIKTHATEMGSLRTRPRLFNKDIVNAFLVERSSKRLRAELRTERHRQVVALVDHVIKKRSQK